MVDQLGLFPAYLTPAPEPPPEGTLAGLTLWQPWAHAVAHLGKRTENRPWKPWPSIVGRLLAIHAAAKVDVAEEARAAEFIRTKVGLAVPEASTLPRATLHDGVATCACGRTEGEGALVWWTLVRGTLALQCPGCGDLGGAR